MGGQRTKPRREPIDTTREVETPEHVRFRYRVAGPARRAAAYAIDLVVRGLLMVVLGLVLTIGALAGGGGEGLAGVSMGVALAVFFVMEWGYFVLLETLMGGRSIGKRALNLRVVRSGGVPLGFADSVLRNLLRAADILPFGYAIGVLVMGRDRYFRRLGDMVAGTLVVSEERDRIREPLKIHPPPSAAELQRIPPKPALSAGDIEAIELFVSRYGQLAPTREEELAELVAPIYAKRMNLRYRSPARFLALLYFRATQPAVAQALQDQERPPRAEPPPPPGGFTPPGPGH